MSIVMANESRGELRARLLRTRDSMTPEEKSAKDAILISRLDMYVQRHCAKGQTIGFYHPHRNEPNLFELAHKWIDMGFKVALPVVVEKHTSLFFALFQPHKPLCIGAYGILEPELSMKDNVKLDMLVVPCVGFNAQNFRMGYGGGYYDRTLSANPVRTVGVAYGFSQCEFEAGTYEAPLGSILWV